MMHHPSRRVHDFACAMYYTILSAFYSIIDWKNITFVPWWFRDHKK
jgi:hypothetical protein